MSETTAFRTGFKIDRTARLIALARLTLVWERVWPNLWPASGIAGAFVTAALFGLFADLDWQLHALILSALTVAIAVALYRGFENFSWPSWSEGARRIERDSTLSHRPITEGGDALAAGKGDPVAEEFWRAHLQRLLAGIRRLRLSLPAPGLPRRDPYALRFLVLLAVIAGFIFAGPDWNQRLSAALHPNVGEGLPLPTLDAWINPPAYTGEAPIYLRHGQGAQPIAVPTGSVLSLRVHGAAYSPDLSFVSSKDHAPDFRGARGDYGANIAIRSNAEVRVHADGQKLGSWRIRAIPDIAPVIAFASPPGKTEHDALKLSYTAGDDYGVASAQAVIRPLSGKKAPPLIVDLPVSQGKTVTQTVYRDLTGHPYAGSEVEITLVAKDAIGQVGKSRPVRMRLPERIFTNPLARALVEQRRHIATGDAAARKRALLALDALTLAPDLFYDGHAGTYLALRTAYWTLKSARGSADYQRVEDILWQTALALEQGGLTLAAEQLRELQQMISDALARGAPQDEIDALLQRYQQAMQRYLRALAQNPPPQTNTPLPPDAKVLSPEDLDRLLKAIQQLAQTGNRQQAQQLMQLLQNLIENMRLAQGGQGGGQGNASPGDKAMSDAIQDLGDLMGKQRGLLDKTFRQEQGAGNPQDGGPQGLANQQNQLRQDLNKILQGLGAQKIPVPDALSRAGRAMGNSEQALNGQNLQGSGNEQQNALDALRQGADALARSLMQKMGQQGQGGQNQDPLGRTAGSRGGNFGSNVKIPDQSDLERAREILQELRKRAAERGRPQEELDYIDRLLKEF